MDLELLRRDLVAPAAEAAFGPVPATRCAGRHRWDSWLYRVEASTLVPSESAGPGPRTAPAGRRHRHGNHRRRYRLVELVDIIRAVRIVPWT